jgi:gas vesicle protein
MKANYFFLGAVIGVAVGGVLGLLLAPASGADSRRQIQGWAENVQLEVKSAAEQRRADLERQLAELRAPRRLPAE